MPNNVTSAEDRLDANYHLIAIVFLCIGIIHAVAAGQDVVTKGSVANTVVSGIRQFLLITTPLLCVFTAWKCLSSARQFGPSCLLVKGGFVFHSIKKAAIVAGISTYFSLIAMHGFSDDAVLPVKFYLNLAMAIMTLTFSITYLFSSRVKADDDAVDIV